ncbi:chorismate synthase [Lentzea sp. PSKA42]|uniref:Chorismate synthase n=1 Tax=Lentzea indica TaxID=2604800 RepID=A0ABX1FPF2_9PSEU|nr:chorismate synthase [Lentzea indica]NKE60672.1 chorismate synthase [Lentzea indica]
MRFQVIGDVPGIARVATYYAKVWETTEDVLSTETLHCIRHAGGATIGAFDGDELVGATTGLFCPDGSVYSMIAAAKHGVGYSLKQAQKDWAVGLGAKSMRWTYDPLVSRNARFNLVKLGAVVTEYTVDFYGSMRDGVNEGDESDRLTVQWDLTSERETRESEPAGEVTRAAPDGEPLARTDGERIWCRVPRDIVQVRKESAELAKQWREAVRGVFVGAFDTGYVATSMSRDGWYQLERK